MPAKTVSIGLDEIHQLPDDLRSAIVADPVVYALWEDITPIARNEWICWVISGKKEETRQIRIDKGLSKMRGGMRRPCCWPGCPHRNPKNAKWFRS